MAKFTSKEKILSVLRYVQGNEPMSEIAKDIGVQLSNFSTWVRLYEHQGESAFIKSYQAILLSLKWM